MATFRADLFFGLPTELQENVLQKLNSREHLRAFSATTRQLRALVLPVLYSKVELGSLVSTDKVQAFASKCAPLHGRHCRDLKLAFSLGPMLDTEDDQYRARLFADILQHCSQNLRTLIFDAAGSNLSDCAATLDAMATGAYPNLERLDMRYYDPEEDEILTVAKVFNSIASSPTLMPQLHDFALQGEWTLSSTKAWQDEIDTFPMFHGLSSLLRNRPNMTSLCLSHLTIDARDLQKLLKEASNLETLTLDSLESFSLQDCLISLIDTPAQLTLKMLTFHKKYLMIPSGNLRFPDKKEHNFPSLKGFVLTLNQNQKIATTSDLSVFALYGSLFRCTQLTFPSLEMVSVDDAFSFSLGTAKTLAMHLLMARRKTMPNLKQIVYAEQTTDANVSVIEPLLEKCGVRLTRGGPAKQTESNRMDYEDTDSASDGESSITSSVAAMTLRE